MDLPSPPGVGHHGAQDCAGFTAVKATHWARAWCRGTCGDDQRGCRCVLNCGVVAFHASVHPPPPRLEIFYNSCGSRVLVAREGGRLFRHPKSRGDAYTYRHFQEGPYQGQNALLRLYAQTIAELARVQEVEECNAHGSRGRWGDHRLASAARRNRMAGQENGCRP